MLEKCVYSLTLYDGSTPLILFFPITFFLTRFPYHFHVVIVDNICDVTKSAPCSKEAETPSPQDRTDRRGPHPLAPAASHLGRSFHRATQTTMRPQVPARHTHRHITRRHSEVVVHPNL